MNFSSNLSENFIIKLDVLVSGFLRLILELDPTS